jgi:hypothetical protein
VVVDPVAQVEQPAVNAWPAAIVQMVDGWLPRTPRSHCRVAPYRRSRL